MNGEQTIPMQERKPLLIAAAWLGMLAVSDFPDIILNRLGGEVPSWLLWAKVGFLALFLGLTLLLPALRRLWPYALALLVLFLALGLTSLIRATAWFQGHFNYKGVSFSLGFLALSALDILVALAVIAALWLMKRDRKAFFLVKGQLDAPIEPVRWLGIKKGNSWKTFGFIFAGVAGLGVCIPTILGIAPTATMLEKALPLLPVVLVLAAINAFTEEVYFRANILSTLHQVIGRTHTLLITIVFFGLAHYLYGSPPGIIGASMVGFLAFLLGKSMLETRGLFWPWFIHFVPDVVIFASYALLFVKT
jgi:membrane protease YdiL (CAAX protease family)